MLPDGGQDGPRSATDVMPAFARGHLGEADGSMSTPCSPPSPPISTAGSLLNPPQGEGAGGHTGRYMFPTYRYSLWENTQISEPSRSKASNIYLKE